MCGRIDGRKSIAESNGSLVDYVVVAGRFCITYVRALLASVAFAFVVMPPVAEGASDPVAKGCRVQGRLRRRRRGLQPGRHSLAINALFVGPDVQIWEWRKQRVERALDMKFGTMDGRVHYSPDEPFWLPDMTWRRDISGRVLFESGSPHRRGSSQHCRA